MTGSSETCSVPSSACVIFSGMLGRLPPVAQTQVGPDLLCRRRPVEGVDVQAGGLLVQQLLAQMGGDLDADLAHLVGVVRYRVEEVGQPLGELGAVHGGEAFGGGHVDDREHARDYRLV